jgi:hypothetical protein
MMNPQEGENNVKPPRAGSCDPLDQIMFSPLVSKVNPLPNLLISLLVGSCSCCSTSPSNQATAPSSRVLGLAAAVRGSHLRLDHGRNCSQQTAGGCNECVKLAVVQMRAAHPICHNLPVCGRFRLSRRKQIVEEYFDSVSDEPEWCSALQHRPHPACSSHPPKSKGTCPGTIFDSVGTHPVMGQRTLWGRQHD